MATPFATENFRLSHLVKQELWPSSGYCRKALPVVEANDAEYVIGTVLSAHSDAESFDYNLTANPANVGGGTVGSFDFTGPAKPGTYQISMITAGATANYTVSGPDGVIGVGTVGTAFDQGGVVLTVSDGAPDFAIGDGFTIVVTGRYTYQIIQNNGNFEVPAAIVIENKSVVGTEETQVLCLVKGPAEVSKAALVLDSSYNDDQSKERVYEALEALGINVLDAV